MNPRRTLSDRKLPCCGVPQKDNDNKKHLKKIMNMHWAEFGSSVESLKA